MKTLKLTLLSGIAVAAASFTGVSAPANAQEPMIGQISGFANNFCPRSWARTEGQLLPIATNQALFSILGTTYGGDGRTSFALPDLRGRTPIGDGQGAGLPSYFLGQKAGSETILLTTAHLPAHSHAGTLATTTEAADNQGGVRNYFAVPATTLMYATGDPALNNMHRDTLRINSAGSGNSFSKTQPFTAIQFCIAIQGLFPSRN